MTKRITAILLLIAIIVSIASCTAGESYHTETETQTQTESETQAPDPPLQTEPLIQLDCFAERGYFAELVDAGEKRIGVLFSGYGEDNEDGDNRRQFCLVNLADNSIENKCTGLEIAGLIGVGVNGEIIGTDYNNEAVKVYSSDASLLFSFDFNSYGSAVFDKKTQSILCIDNDTLFRVYLDGHREDLDYLPGAINIDIYDSERNILYLNDGNTGENIRGHGEHTAYSVADKKALYTVPASGIVNCSWESVWCISLFTGTESITSQEAFIKQCSVDNGMVQRSYRLPDDGFLSEMGDEGYAFWINYSYDISDKETYRMLDLNRGMVSDWSADADIVRILDGKFVNCGKNFACLATDIDDNIKLYLTDPTLLDYGSTLESAMESETEKIESSESFSTQRSLADRIEEEFSVRILIGEQSRITEGVFGYGLVPTDGEDEGQLESLTAELNNLEYILGRYPEGFFENFLSYRKAGGLRITLVKDFTNPSGEFIPAGVTNYMDGWYDIAIDTDALRESLFHHEMWHAIENRITIANPKAFDLSKWSELNPTDFEYCNDLDNYSDQRELFKMTLLSSKKKAYFIDLYSTVTAFEDRATIIETILSESYDAEYYGYSNPLTMLSHCPYLDAKLSYMENAMKSVFKGQAYWYYVLGADEEDFAT